MSLVYKISTTESESLYIGKTVQTLEERFKQHLYNAKNDKSNNHFYNAINKYGPDTFTCELVEEIEVDLLSEREKFWIKTFDTFNNGYNSTEGGEGLEGFSHSDETKKLISESSKGRLHSEETKKKLSEFHKGSKWSDSQRQKIEEAREANGYPMEGKSHSDETKLKMSESHKGKELSEKDKERLRTMNIGSTHSDETKLKMSEAKKGKKKPTMECPHCNKIGGVPQIKRWHLDNCKQKKKD